MLEYITKIQKRSGDIETFDQEKIQKAVFKALTATGEAGQKEAQEVTSEVVRILNLRFEVGQVPQVEQVQDIVEEILMVKDFIKTARAFILYRDQRRRIRELGEVYDEAVEIYDQYISEMDWQVKENANMAYSLQGLNNYGISSLSKRYWLNKIYPKPIRDALESGDFHIHDLDVLGAYCCGWDLYDLLLRGFGGVKGKVECAPAKHLSSALGQVVNFLYTLQGESAGAQAMSSFDTLLAPFIRYDNLSYSQVKKSMQSFMFNCAVPTRVGFQTPFSNITLDLHPAASFVKLPVIIGGKPQKETYVDFQAEMDLLNQAFYEVIMEGDKNGRIFTFPIPTVNITKDFDWQRSALEALWQATAKYGVNYFANFIQSDMNPEDVRSMCKLPHCQIIYKNANGEIAKTPIRRIVDDFIKRGNRIEVLMNGQFKPVKDVLKLKLTAEDVLKIKLDNGVIDKMTMDHPSVIITEGNLKVVESKDLKVGDEFPISKYHYEGELGDFDLGRVIGLYLGDGWLSHNGATVNFVFNKKEKKLIDFVSLFAGKRYATKTRVEINEKHNYCRVAVASRALGELIKEYARGDGSLVKRINSKSFARCVDFRKGMLIGIIESDGSVVNRKYIALHLGNKGLIKDILILSRTLGVNATYFESKNKTGEKEKMAFYLRFAQDVPSWIGGYFALNKGKNLKYKEYEHFFGVKIVSIEKIKYTGYVYDFEIDSKEHLFQLANGIITHNCCRLRLSNKELLKKGGGLFGANPQTGSIGVVTVNMPRIGYLSKTRGEFFQRLGAVMDLSKDSLEIKRKAVEDFMEKGLYPYSKHYLANVKTMRGVYYGNHFSTIGLLGLNECLLNFMGETIASTNGRQFALEVLNFMRERIIGYQEQTGNLYNLEATPAEGASFRLALKDKKKYENIITAGTKEVPYYTNSSQLPVNYTDDVFEALDLQDNLQCAYTGGTVEHIFLGERLSDIETVKHLVKTVFTNYKLPYITLTPTFSICPVHGYLSGERWKCPQCMVDQDCEVYSRVVGYLRPVQQWHKGKAQEFKERKVFTMKPGYLKKG